MFSGSDNKGETKMNRLNNITKPLMWFMALVLTAFMAGCGGGSSSSSSVPSLLNSAKSINTFSIAWSTGLAPDTATGTIDQTLKTIKATVPHATLLTPMIATFTASPGVSVTVGTAPVVTQVSGETENDFTLPVSYKVTAADGTYATYIVLISRDQTVTSLAVTPPTASTPKGATYQFAANATYLDASIYDVTATASWTSAASGVASVGLHTGLAVGVTANGTPVVITAAIGGQTQTATAAMTVTDAALLSIAVSPATGATTPVGGTQQFVAIGTYTDGSTPVVTTTANWASGAGASIGLNTGIATGLPANAIPVDITATMGTVVSNTAGLLVTAPPGPNLLRTASFAVLAGPSSSITNAGNTNVTGDVGTPSVIGAALNVTGAYDPTCGTQACQDAMTDLPAVITDVTSTTNFPCDTTIAGGDLATVTLIPGVTCILSDAAISNTGIVTLNGPGVYIIRTNAALTATGPSSVAYSGGATDANTTVFWVVTSVAFTSTTGSAVDWIGNLLATTGAIDLGDYATLTNGRVLTTAAITLSKQHNHQTVRMVALQQVIQYQDVKQ